MRPSSHGPTTAAPTAPAHDATNGVLARTETTRFRCACGRSVAAPRGSDAATSGRCSTCRLRHRAEDPLHRN